MKVKQLALAIVMIAAVTALSFAQKVEFHGYMDYSTYIGGYSVKDGSSDWQNSDLYSLYGSWYGGRTEGTITVSARNFLFTTGVRLGTDMGTWYDLYTDNDPFFKGNVRADFLNGLLRVYTGKYEEENFGYFLNGLAWGCAYGTAFADRGTSQYFTGVEVKPAALVDGLTVLVGLPVLPGRYDQGMDSLPADDEITVLLKQFKAAAKYSAPFGATFFANFHGANWDQDDTTYAASTTKYREATLNVDVPNLAKLGIALRAGYDWQQKIDNEDGMKHNALLSVAYRPLSKLWTAIDGRVAYATGDFETTTTRLFLAKAQVKATYDLPSQMQVGCLGNVGYMKDDSGSLTNSDGYAAIATGDDGDLGFCLNNSAMRLPDAVTSATEGSSFSWGVNPYLQKNFSNGFVSAGLLFQYNNYTSGTTNTALTYAIPVNVCFWY